MTVLYEHTVSAIVEAVKVGGRSAIYAHLHSDSVKIVNRSADKVVLVVEHVNASVKNALALLGDKAKLVVAKRRWYANYVYKHLIEPRIKDELTKNTVDEYAIVLKAEYKTIEMCRRVLSIVTPIRIGDFVFATVPRLPTGDVTILYYEKYLMPVFVASARDTGIAWSAIADKAALTELARRFSNIGYVDSNLSLNPILSGFIMTYPEPPKAYLPIIEEVLKNILAKPPESIKASKTAEAVKMVTDFYEYLKFKTKCLSWSSYKTIISGKAYTVIRCGQNAPHYVSTLSGNVCTVVFYLPPPDRLLVATPFTPKEIRTSKSEVKITPITSTPDAKHLSMVPMEVVRELRSMLRKYGKAVLSVTT